MTDTGDVLAPGTRLGELEIDRVLGSGGFGITYLARDLSLDTWRAVKEYLPRDWGTRRKDGTIGPRTGGDEEDYQWGLERFLDEARILARFDHRHLVRVHRVFEARGTAYMVTEYVEGRTLAAEFKDEGPLAETRVREVLLALTDGLSAVHAADLLHRDIKPGNVMARQDGTPVLIDFGAARQAIGRHSRSVTAVLTPGYAPIEQYSARGNQGPWTDIYALGAVAYWALGGGVPEDATERIRNDPLRPLTEAVPGRVGVELARAVDAALAVTEEDRPQSLTAWRALLEGRAAHVAPEVSRAPTPADGGEPGTGLVPAPRRRWWLASAAAAGLVAVVLLAALAVPWNGAFIDETGAADGEAQTSANASPTAEAASGTPDSGHLDSLRTAGDEAARVEARGEVERAAEAQREAERAAAAQRQALAPGTVFRDCALCPELVVVPAGEFMMGSNPQDDGSRVEERPQHRVTVGSFALGRYEVTRGEYAAFVEATSHATDGGCFTMLVEPNTRGPGSWRWVRDDQASWLVPGFLQAASHPAVCVSWLDAQAYVEWLSAEGGKTYRLPSEAEWEYSARAGTVTTRYWGDGSFTQCGNANGGDNTLEQRLGGNWNFAECTDGVEETAPAGSFAPNAFGLYDMAGNVWEWVQDCWHESYDGAPRDGSDWTNGGDCGWRGLRGGAWNSSPANLRSALRNSDAAEYRSDLAGFRVLRTLD